MLRSGPAVIVHHYGHDGQLMAHHGIEFCDGEADRAVTDEAEYWPLRMRHLRSHRQAKPKAHRAEKTMRDVTARMILSDHLVHPVIRLGSVSHDDRVLGDIVHNRRDSLKRMNRRAAAL